MRRKNVTNAIIRESITEALLLLMQVQPFAQITITDLVQKAGVSRVSFYRNFESKEDVLLCRLDETARSWWASFPEEPENYLFGIFTHCLALRDLIALLYRQGLAPLLWQNLRSLIGPADGDAPELAYKKACLTGALFGLLSEWVRRGMTDSPEAMSALFDPKQVAAFVAELDISLP